LVIAVDAFPIFAAMSHRGSIEPESPRGPAGPLR